MTKIAVTIIGAQVAIYLLLPTSFAIFFFGVETGIGLSALFISLV